MQSSRLIALLNQQRAVVYVGLATFLFTLAQGVSIFTYPLYGRELGLTLAQVGFTVSAFAVARVFTNVPSAMISNRVGRRWVLIAGGLFAAAGYVLSANAGLVAAADGLSLYRRHRLCRVHHRGNRHDCRSKHSGQ